ncbi:MAG: NADH-quinone oxidoreductase subunit NuoK [Alistipes sp.]|nr:NADH-quinone oxidoreductase subunit NuoK [Alistipes sp.]
MEIQMQYYLLLGVVMFFAGVYGFITRRNLIAVLISVELNLNAVDINFAVFNRYLYPGELEGMFFTIFAIAIAAAETAVAIAIIINVYRNLSNIEVRNLDQLQEPTETTEPEEKA